MAIPRKRILALTVAVWLAAAGSAAALTYELNRPLVERPLPAASAPRTPAASPPGVTDQAEPSESLVLRLPPITIAAPAVHRPLVAPIHLVAPIQKKPRDISAMGCAEWRDLDMGSGHVQICE